MNWDYDLSIANDELTALPAVSYSSALVINCSADNSKPTWHKAGYLKAFVTIASEKVCVKKITLYFGSQLIEIPFKNYSLEFEAVYYANNSRLKIYQLSKLEIQAMNISIPPFYPPEVKEKAPVKVNASATSIVIVPANYNRASCTIINNSDKDMWVNLHGDPAVTGFPSIRVSRDGGNINTPDNFYGAINAIWEGTPSYHAHVHEFDQA